MTVVPPTQIVVVVARPSFALLVANCIYWREFQRENPLFSIILMV